MFIEIINIKSNLRPILKSNFQRQKRKHRKYAFGKIMMVDYEVMKLPPNIRQKQMKKKLCASIQIATKR